MLKPSQYVLRVGLGITFIWIGILVIQHPGMWGAYIDEWAMNLIKLVSFGIEIDAIMMVTGAFDIAVGLLIVFGRGNVLWLASLFGGLHIAAVLATTGIDDVTVRDIGLMAASFAIALEAWPQKLAKLR